MEYHKIRAKVVWPSECFSLCSLPWVRITNIFLSQGSSAALAVNSLPDFQCEAGSFRGTTQSSLQGRTCPVAVLSRHTRALPRRPSLTVRGGCLLLLLEEDFSVSASVSQRTQPTQTWTSVMTPFERFVQPGLKIVALLSPCHSLLSFYNIVHNKWIDNYLTIVKCLFSLALLWSPLREILWDWDNYPYLTNEETESWNFRWCIPGHIIRKWQISLYTDLVVTPSGSPAFLSETLPLRPLLYLPLHCNLNDHFTCCCSASLWKGTIPGLRPCLLYCWIPRT